MRRRGLIALALGGLAAGWASGLSAQESYWPSAAAPDPARFAPAIGRFAQADAARPPPPCGLLFVGSSSIRLWKTLPADMAPWPVINRGFGGARITDVDYWFDQVVAPYRPRAIVFYGGENDLWAGASPQALVGDFQRFLALKTRALGDTPVYFISLKPSPKRASQRALQADLNRRIQALAATRRDLAYVDIAPAMIGPDGAPRDLFTRDGLHMRAEGYGLWTQALKPALAAVQARRCGARPAALAVARPRAQS